MKKVIAAMTVLAVCESRSASSISVAYILYDDGTVAKIGPKNKAYVNLSQIIIWPFTEEEARELLEAKRRGFCRFNVFYIME